jgi:NUMOD3 motif-containing protein
MAMTASERTPFSCMLRRVITTRSRAAKRANFVNHRFQDRKHDADYSALDKAVADFGDVLVEGIASVTVQKACQSHENDDDGESGPEARLRRDVQECRGHLLAPPSCSADEGYSLTVAKAASCDRDPQAKFSRMLPGSSSRFRPCDAMLDISSPALILIHKRARTKGMKPVSQETRAKMSAARKGMKLSAQHRANISAGCKGLKRSAEARANISAGHKGKPRPELRGRKLSREHIAKISAFHKGRRLPEATRAKMRAARFA